ncbi:acetyl/propionyl/methylcrotonyl-CoA carboxylase subunit alpha [Neisseria shayeganii]|uniref:Acetyl/propionyl/methylcrotonyl-CoA carboxylase subunit alpha n=1 Tax=Neisseria shayeganii TaxID=607712 RepID=A0A7D7N4R5_9NEIS|nr:acetyl/propionyl/methylcrotonyl-CoA carboxylase subunit alpha [Neisseria shayeganii]QMT39483.1 acetyl/propionyl/methylcrotonyl-CoA carboxylase subunit alpha [Neisseria shayeganii]
MFKKILIANRGEIACRVAATARKLGVRTVAVYSDADAEAKHVAACDEAVHIGGSAPKESYLLWERVIQAAKDTGAEAIHPGYGFLSENEQFAQACADAGLVFIGPPASAIKAMGLKAESKQLMQQAGVPLVPGYHESNQDADFLKQQADAIGYPVLIKASSGGGGKGMRMVERSEDFLANLESCRREAQNSFGNDAVLVEKYVLKPRHIEIQIFGDTHGNYVHLFERDCSVQRRHQKVLEEAPAPGVSEQMRAEMGAAAVAAAKAVNYVGAGTVEFIVEQRDGQMTFYFMEMNTRLQVEHPVTEAITGTDLVEWQLRVAAGEKLPKTQDELSITGHAIEARICAENPDNQFLPATGTLVTYRKPEHEAFQVASVRVDDGVREGDTISQYYDSMIAKLIVHAPSRGEALAKLDNALADTRIVGLPNNVAFLRHILVTESFSGANLDTALIEREKAALFDQPGLDTEWAVAAALTQALSHEHAAQGQDPFTHTDGWRPYTDYLRGFSLDYNGEALKAQVCFNHDGSQNLSISRNGETVFEGRYAFRAGNDHTATITLNKAQRRLQYWTHGEDVHVFSMYGSSRIRLIDDMAHTGEEAQDGGRLTSPMPGKVVSFAVQPGDKVSKGQPLAVIEAMKIEHTISAPADGVVAEILFAAGDLVADGDELLKLSQAE